MNTLSRNLTARFFASSTEYFALRCHWSQLVNSDRRHTLTATHHLLYLALLGRDWRKAFTLPTNQNNLANGGFVAWGLFRAVQQLHSRVFESQMLEPFDGRVTGEMLEEIRMLIPLSLVYAYRLSDFANSLFPFQAFDVPTEWLDDSPEVANA